MRFALLTLFGVIIFSISATGVCEKRNQFFPTNSAKTVFQDDISFVSKQSNFEFFRAKRKSKDEINGKDSNIQNNLTSNINGEQPEQDLQKEESSLLTSEDIIKKYGNPQEELPVLAQDKSPKPFKAMMASLASDNVDLAFQYARQYVRYLHNLQKSTHTATGIIAKAMQVEGYANSSDWTGASTYSKYNALLNKNKKNNKDNFIPSDTIKDIEEINEEKENYSNYKKLTIKEEEEVRRKIRYKVLRDTSIPVDTKGEVDIYFFFKPKEADSIAMARNLDKIYRLYKDKGINIVGLYLDVATPISINKFKLLTSVSFPIYDGQVLAQTLKVNSTPTTAFIARNTSKTYLTYGKQDFIFIDEVTKKIRGVANNG